MSLDVPENVRWRKYFSCALLIVLCAVFVAGCSTNRATGKRQFTALMPADKEDRVGAQEHQKIIKQYGLYKDAALEAYVSAIGARVTKMTERPEVTYKFYILDTPIVNAFALPGGYVYVSRGLLALANSEAELAAVLAHEAAHITARHSAQRYSRSVVTSVGANILSAVVGHVAVSQALGLGQNLYLSGYSRSQENEADALGLRYMSQGGYDPEAMAGFLHALERNTSLHLDGKDDPSHSYFSTHPPTPERVSKTKEAASFYKATYQMSAQTGGRDVYLRQIEGLVYGDSAAQGFGRKGRFYHPGLDFTFDVPAGYKVINQPSQIALKAHGHDGVAIFDFAQTQEPAASGDAASYLRYVWMKDEELKGLERVSVGGMPAAMAEFRGKVNGKDMIVRLMAVAWGQGRYARFKIGVPEGLSKAGVDQLRSLSYSLRKLNAQEKKQIKPPHVKIVYAKAGDRLDSFAAQQIFKSKALDHFRVLNGLSEGEGLQAGRAYKLIMW